MKIDELTRDEQLVLIGLVRLVMRADKKLSDLESHAAAELCRVMGSDLFYGLAAVARKRFRTPEDIQHVLGTVTRREAQKLIVEKMEWIASIDGKVPAEEELLVRVRAAWEIE
ncbi:MAG: hypothetical protein HN348_02950 [Proteobacteria bacterium]|jgi:hypothetical protein|nr:hypothetical protein [Pseudomonadota bacterium]